MPQQQEIRASLGCGTLILIAIIVILFGGHSDHNILETKIDKLTAKVERLQDEVEELREDLEEKP